MKVSQEWYDDWTRKQAAALQRKESQRLEQAAGQGEDNPGGSVVEPRPQHPPHDAEQVQASRSGRYLVRITCRRVRLFDSDNSASKFALDALRYAGAIPDDTEANVLCVCQQEKVRAEDEETLIEIYPPGFWREPSPIEVFEEAQ